LSERFFGDLDDDFLALFKKVRDGWKGWAFAFGTLSAAAVLPSGFARLSGFARFALFSRLALLSGFPGFSVLTWLTGFARLLVTLFGGTALFTAR
jgi:hypothetical protein